jgi:hypothetical protein
MAVAVTILNSPDAQSGAELTQLTTDEGVAAAALNIAGAQFGDRLVQVSPGNKKKLDAQTEQIAGFSDEQTLQSAAVPAKII